MHQGPDIRHVRCVDKIISTHSFCQRKSAFRDVDRNHPRSERPAESDRRQPHTTASVHAQHLTGHEASSFDDTSIGRRYPTPDERGNLVRNLVGNHHSIDVGKRNGGEAGECPPPGEAGLLLMSAYLVLSQETRFASTATTYERRHDAIAHRHAVHPASNGDNTTDKLVTADMRAHDVGVRPMPPVQVAPAETDRQNLDNDLARPHVGVGNDLHPDRPAEAFVDRCPHADNDQRWREERREDSGGP